MKQFDVHLKGEKMTLTVSVINGDLAFISEPLLVGHYVSLGLTGSEAAVDQLLAGKLRRSLRARDYPEELGSTKIFKNSRLPADNSFQQPRPAAVIVVGLGPEGVVQAAGLRSAIANGIVAWALHAEEHEPNVTGLPLAATLIGSGGLNFSAGQSAQVIVQAVIDANARLAAVDVPEDARQPPLVESLTLVDLYLDRASEAWRALNEFQLSGIKDFRLEPQIVRRDAALDRPLESGYRGSRYDLIIATWEEFGDGNASVRYRIDTRRARSEIQSQSAQIPLLRQLLADGSNPDDLDRVLGRTLFNLLVPVEMAPVMAGSTDMQIEVDSRTAVIPWELLDTPKDTKDTSSNKLPWAMRTKLLRKLRTATCRSKVDEALKDAGVLVIGEPACPASYARLPGARREARTVQKTFEASGWKGRVKSLIASDAKDLVGPDGRMIMRVLLDRPWRVIHVCGHGEAANRENPHGVVLSDGAFLGSREVANMQPVPELVFLNCCFAGAHSASELNATTPGGVVAHNPQFAANIADQLISIGVRCVVATGWAIDDEAAEAFASAFYSSLLRGSRYIDAVDLARKAAYGCARGGNTWAAYQCYGDPDWRLQLAAGDAQAPTMPLAEALACVASVPGLILALQTMAVRAKYQHERDEAAKDALRELERRFEKACGHRGEVAEAFGDAWFAVGDRELATVWFERAVMANDGAATFKAAENLLNLRARAAYDEFDALFQASGGNTTGEIAPEQSDLDRAGAAAAKVIEEVVESLSKLSAVSETSERANLCGSACKRLSMIHQNLNEHEDAAECIARMRNHYARGWELSQGNAHVDAFYPAMNVLAATVALGEAWDSGLAERVQQLVRDHQRASPNFWNVVASIEIAIWEALSLSRVEQCGATLRASLADLHDRVSDLSMWGSVLDQTRFVVIARSHRHPLESAEQAAVDGLMTVLSAHATFLT